MTAAPGGGEGSAASEAPRPRSKTGPVVGLWGCPPELRGALEVAGWRAVDGAEDVLPRRLMAAGARVVVVGPSVDAVRVAGAVRGELPGAVVVAWCPAARPADVRRILRGGADDVVLEEAPLAVASALAACHDSLASADGADGHVPIDGIVGRSESLADVLSVATQIARTPATVLITGETGTGKELMARAIHRRSGRAGRFVAVNCGGVPEALIESELFGYVRGAFTGATGDKAGLFRHAHGGTLFLDEVDSLPAGSQASLLRVLQEGRVRPIGGGDEALVDVRVLAATSSRLDDAVAAGRFRADLHYRLDVIRLHLPPLRERPDDVGALFEHFRRQLAAQHGLPTPHSTPEFLEVLRRHAWPGNVRELRNLTERVVLTRPAAVLEARHARQLLMRDPPTARLLRPQTSTAQARAAPLEIDLTTTLTDFLVPYVADLERTYLDQALRLNEGRMDGTAATSGLSRRTLLRKLHQLGIDRRAYCPRRGRSSPSA